MKQANQALQFPEVIVTGVSTCKAGGHKITIEVGEKDAEVVKMLIGTENNSTYAMVLVKND